MMVYYQVISHDPMKKYVHKNSYSQKYHLNYIYIYICILIISICLMQVVNEATMQACSEKPLCVVSVLPHILDCNAACRNDYLAILARLGDKYKNKMWG